MDIKITRQKYENECGVCVLNSIYNFLYPNEKINKLDILNISNLSEKGMSLYEFKMVGQKINIDIKLYELPFKELLNYENDKYFVTCLEGNRNKHFVICKKNNKSFIVYDSNGSINKYSYEEFEDIYSKIFITFKSKLFTDNKQIKLLSNKNILFDLPNEYIFIGLILAINFISIFLNLIINGFIKILIDIIIPYNLNFELIYFFLFFINIYVLNQLLMHFLSLIKINKFRQLFFNNLIIYTSILSNKKFIFFQKISKETINEYPNSISNVIVFRYFEYPELISNIIYAIVLILVICFVNYLFIIPVLVILCFCILFNFIKFKNNKDNFICLHLNKNKIINKHNNLIDFLLKEKDQIKYDELSQSFHNEINNYYNRYELSNKSLLNANLFETLITKFIIISFTFICSYLLINKYTNFNLSISTIIFLLSIISILMTCFNDIFGFICGYSIYSKNKNLIDDLVELHNKNYIDEGKWITKIKQINISNLDFEYESKVIFKNLNLKIKNGSLIMGNNGIGKSTLLNLISFKYGEYENITFDGLYTKQINLKKYDDNIIYIPSNSILNIENYLSAVNNLDTINISNKILKQTKINISKNNFSEGEKQIISLINILDVKNKIILLDESFSNVNSNCFDLLYKHVKNHLEKNNFVIWVSNDKNIKKYFNRIINLDKK